ncbi:MAG: Ca2+-binding EF-hand superfamily protein [Myxococcota bacterium]|jgi:Ca2+-binding EF-hand superfamily protein
MLGEGQWKKLVRLFTLLDVDKSGAVEFTDLEQVMARTLAASGHAPGSIIYDGAEAMLRRFWSELKQIADANRDDRISRAEWLACWERLLDSEDTDSIFEDLPHPVRQLHLLLAQALGVNDLNGADRATWVRFAGSVGGDASDAAFDSLDLDGNGLISQSELQQLTAEFFLSNDAAPGDALFGALA